MPHTLLENTGAVELPHPPTAVQSTLPIVAIGASVGGLQAYKQLLSTLRADSGMAYIFVQHLEPTHTSILVELLVDHSPIPLTEATHGQKLEANRGYVIPPGSNLAVEGDILLVTRQEKQPGSRLSFNFLLKSLALNSGNRAMCVVLTGTGNDGSIGLEDIKSAGGFVIVQDPAEAAANGMPTSAIATGFADMVLPISQIAAALENHTGNVAAVKPKLPDSPEEPLSQIIALLQSQTGQDFSPYKHGTLLRRIDRRMKMASMPEGKFQPYLDLLNSDSGEIEHLGKDLLIHVTSFFRDTTTFERLEQEVLPALLNERKSAKRLRVWVAGCSTGEEAYSLAMILLETIATLRSN